MGSSLDDFLKEEGVYEEFCAAAIKKVVAWQIQQGMKQENLSKTSMARRMGTSRGQLDRLLDPTEGNVSLETLQRAATALGRELRIDFKPAAKAPDRAANKRLAKV